MTVVERKRVFYMLNKLLTLHIVRARFFFLISSPLSGFPLLRNFYVHTPPLRLYLEMYVSSKTVIKIALLVGTKRFPSNG